jgi:hypothetical protein
MRSRSGSAHLQALGLRDRERFDDSDGAYNIEYGQPS